MTDAEYEAEKARVDAVIDRWIDRLGLKGQAVFFVSFHRERGSARAGDFEVAASMDSEWQYRQAKLHVYCETTAKEDDDMLDLLIAHEFTHYLLDPIAGYVTKAHHEKLEFVTENIARAFRRVREGQPVTGEY